MGYGKATAKLKFYGMNESKIQFLSLFVLKK
jgi:hypothetical protein